ncbi:MAG: hypothetical protein AAFR61_21865 [Bacteroidota bacterium]
MRRPTPPTNRSFQPKPSTAATPLQPLAKPARKRPRLFIGLAIGIGLTVVLFFLIWGGLRKSEEGIYIKPFSVPHKFSQTGYVPAYGQALLVEELSQVVALASQHYLQARAYLQRHPVAFYPLEASGTGEETLIEGSWLIQGESLRLDLRKNGTSWKSFQNEESKASLEQRIGQIHIQARQFILKELTPDLYAFEALMENDCLTAESLWHHTKASQPLQMAEILAHASCGEAEGARLALLRQEPDGAHDVLYQATALEVFFVLQDSLNLEKSLFSFLNKMEESEVAFARRLAGQLTRAGYVVAARKLLKKVLFLQPENPLNQAALARVEMSSGNWKAAQLLWEEIWPQPSQSPELKVAYLTYLRAQARRLSLTGQHPKAWHFWIRLLEQQTQDVEAQSATRALWEQIGYRKSYALGSVKLDPELIKEADFSRWKHIQRGLFYHYVRTQAWDLAELQKDKLSLIYREKRTEWEALLWREHLQYQLGQLEPGEFAQITDPPGGWAALEATERDHWQHLLLQRLPGLNGDSAHASRARLLTFLGRLDPQNHGYLLGAAEAWAQAGNYDEADKIYGRLYQREVQLPVVLEAWGDLWMLAQNPAKALEKYKNASRINNQDFYLLLKQGAAYELDRSYRDANLLLEKGLSLMQEKLSSPSLADQILEIESRARWAFCLQQTGKDGEKKDQYRKATRLADRLLLFGLSDGDQARIRLSLARIHAYKDRYPEMLEALKVALDKGLSPEEIPVEEAPFSSYAMRIQSMLEEL